MTEPLDPTEATTTTDFTSLGVDAPTLAALAARGITEPTSVQRAVLDPALRGRDLLVSSRTGSGKTLAFGLALELAPAEKRESGVCAPTALVVAPTRELAQQVGAELTWALAPRGLRVLVVTGGTSVGGELRALGQGADLVVGTPGRLLDHLTRGALDPARVRSVVLDEADEMLDLGFREELEQILDAMPQERRTVMLSATMPEEIVRLAKRYLKEPARVSADAGAQGHEDITFTAHLVRPAEKRDALVNLLLESYGERIMVFTRTRADAAELAQSLVELGFAALHLSGELAQRERTQTLDAFRAGRIDVLVATDVAARGLDVPEVSLVVHADPPGDAAALTHRSGRTGRAGRKGDAVLLVPLVARARVRSLLREANLKARWVPVPDEAAVRAAAGERMRAKLEGPSPLESAPPEHAELVRALAAQLAQREDVGEVLARLLAQVWPAGPCAPRALRPIDTEREGPVRPTRARPERLPADGFVEFRVTFGERHGATPARLLAMVCRRGGIRGSDVGAIRIGDTSSTFGVDPSAAGAFARAARKPDPREPHVHISPASKEDGPAPGPHSSEGAPPRPRKPFTLKGKRPRV